MYSRLPRPPHNPPLAAISQCSLAPLPIVFLLTVYVIDFPQAGVGALLKSGWRKKGRDRKVHFKKSTTIAGHGLAMLLPLPSWILGLVCLNRCYPPPPHYKQQVCAMWHSLWVCVPAYPVEWSPHGVCITLPLSVWRPPLSRGGNGTARGRGGRDSGLWRSGPGTNGRRAGKKPCFLKKRNFFLKKQGLNEPWVLCMFRMKNASKKFPRLRCGVFFLILWWVKNIFFRKKRNIRFKHVLNGVKPRSKIPLQKR